MDQDFKAANTRAKMLIDMANEGDKTNERFIKFAQEAELFFRTYGVESQTALRLADRLASGEVSDFINEYFSQDNCCTAYPIYFQIRDVAWVSSYHFDEGDRYTMVYDCESMYVAETLKELFEKIKQDECELGLKIPDGLEIDNYISEFDCEEFTQLNEYVTGVFSEKKTEEYKQMFLLKSEAEQHLKSNSHHYSDKADIYCQHAWRAPRQERFFKAMAAQMIKEAQDD